MANPIRDIWNMGKSMLNKEVVTYKVSRAFLNQIGSESEVGAKNGDYYYRIIKGLVNKGKPNEAARFARKERARVLKDK